jgi:hypothetical protein
MLLVTAGLVMAGCCSTQNQIQRLSTSDLQLRRYELKYCLSMARTSWDKRPWQTDADDEVKADLAEKEAIEQEITRRGVTNYHWPPSMTYQYVRDHCHCQSWVAHL